MRADKYKIQIGDVLYQPIKAFKEVKKWEITNIFVEHYISGPKTIFKVVCNGIIYSKFLGDVITWYDTEEEALAALQN